MSLAQADGLRVVSVLELGSSVRALGWVPEGLLVSCADASASLFAFDDWGGTARRRWTVGDRTGGRAAGVGACLADAGATSSAWAPPMPPLLFLPSPLAPANLLALIGGARAAIAWAAALGGSGCVGPPAVSGERVYAHGENGTLTALRQRDGAVQWAWEPPNGAEWEETGGFELVPTGAGPAAAAIVATAVERQRGSAADGNCTAGRVVRALSEGKGMPAIVWEWRPDPNGIATQYDRSASADDSQTALARVRAAQPQPHAGGDAPGARAPSSAARAAAGQPACACEPAMRPPRLERAWASDGTFVLLASIDACAYAPADPAPTPSLSAHPSSASAPRAIASSNASIAALDEATGRVRWHRPLGAGVRCSRAAAEYDGVAYVVCSGGEGAAQPQLLALDTRDGSLAWAHELSVEKAGDAAPRADGAARRGAASVEAHEEDVMCAGSGLGVQCELVVSGSAAPALSVDGVLYVLAAVRPRLSGGAAAPGALSTCVLLRVATRPSLADGSDGGDATLVRAARALPTVRLGSCDGGWFEKHRGSRPLALPRADGVVAAGAGSAAWLVAPIDACAEIECVHGVCRNGSCYCEAGFLAADCSEPYSPYRAEWPVWIGLGATVSLLLVFLTCLVGVYRSFLWVKFRMQMIQVRHDMERRGYQLPQDDSTYSGDAGRASGQQTPRAAPLLAPAPGSGAAPGSVGSSTVSLLADGAR
ncbi:hypothetical protein KFE25_002159 [Diacronema lutheri]|uniref:Pyrrolo-quinoline quinone repeat domain-containing protein n=3 Tax=Diacronema lutheri TaxID=2081491 RepID=A0A8J6CG70_DIALT|nr:hypothetical protein KFE25_002159 [Diacronema lutheri]